MGACGLKSDRRVIKIAMVDCVSQTIQGKTTDVDAEGFIEVFVLTPWVVNGGDHEIYVEVIRGVPIGILQDDSKNFVQLYE